MERKKRVGFITSPILAKTGFSNNIRSILPYLYKTNKYELFHLNQGTPHTDINLQKYPWTNWGAFKEGTFDINRFNNPAEEGYRRFISYGNGVVESFILENKLDIVIHVEDVWSSDTGAYIKSKWWKYLKHNFLQWSTADSEPILPNFKEYAEVCDTWFWTSFAEKILKQENPEKYGHVKTVHGAIRTEEYKPLLKHERLALRKEFNIDPNTIIFIQLGRNQLRKLYPQTLESFYKFKKQNPGINSKLLFHCNWSEPMGWPLERLIKENGLNKEDVLTTYFCKACGKWEIKPFLGEDQNCRYCNSQKTQITAGINSSVTNKDIAKIYSLCDACVSVFTSGGFEFCNAESILCELPLLCSDYVCGKDFTAQDFIFPLDGVFTYEVGTGFKKHVPNINTMIKFYKKICDMTPEQRKEIGRKGREWALSQFDVSVIAPKVEEWIDSRPLIDWDYKYPPDVKNPNAQIDFNIQDDYEFIWQSYEKILNMLDMRDKNKPEVIHWYQFLNQPGDKNQLRQNMVNTFRQIGNQKNIEQNIIPFESVFDNTGRKRLLLAMPESFGDCYLITSIFKSLKDTYPNYDIYVACKNQFKDIFDSNPYIYKVIEWIPQMDNLFFLEGRGQHNGFVDIYFAPYFQTQRLISYTHNGIDKSAIDF